MATEWSGATYARNTTHHRRHDVEFLDDLNPAPTDRILDLGCGVGDFTAQLVDLVPDGQVVGIDSSPSMIDQAEPLTSDRLRFALADVADLGDADLGGPFDLIVSRACLHWVRGPNHPRVLEGVAAQLRSGGRLRAEFGGAGNVPRTLPQMIEQAAVSPYREALGGPVEPWYFATPGTYLDVLLDSPLNGETARVWSVAQLRSMGDLAGLRSWFESQVAISVTTSLPEELRAPYAEAVFDRIAPQCARPDGSYAEIYVRLNVDVTSK